MYRCMHLFSDEARQLAASLTYTPTVVEPNMDKAYPRAVFRGEQVCPIGVMLIHDLHIEHPTWYTRIPYPRRVLDYIGHHFESGDLESLERFIVSFDRGRIDNLHRALGVEEPVNVDV